MTSSSFDFSIDDVVLAEWGRKVFYAKIVKMDFHKRICQLLFDDNSTEQVEFSKIHSVNETTADIVCVVCKEDSTTNKNEIVLCDVCSVGFHQRCHEPAILDGALEYDNPWTCCYCLLKKPNPHIEINPFTNGNNRETVWPQEKKSSDNLFTRDNLSKEKKFIIPNKKEKDEINRDVKEKDKSNLIHGKFTKELLSDSFGHSRDVYGKSSETWREKIVEHKRSKMLTTKLFKNATITENRTKIQAVQTVIDKNGCDVKRRLPENFHDNDEEDLSRQADEINENKTNKICFHINNCKNLENNNIGETEITRSGFCFDLNRGYNENAKTESFSDLNVERNSDKGIERINPADGINISQDKKSSGRMQDTERYQDFSNSYKFQYSKLHDEVNKIAELEKKRIALRSQQNEGINNNSDFSFNIVKSNQQKNEKIRQTSNEAPLEFQTDSAFRRIKMSGNIFDRPGSLDEHRMKLSINYKNFNPAGTFSAVHCMHSDASDEVLNDAECVRGGRRIRSQSFQSHNQRTNLKGSLPSKNADKYSNPFLVWNNANEGTNRSLFDSENECHDNFLAEPVKDFEEFVNCTQNVHETTKETDVEGSETLSIDRQENENNRKNDIESDLVIAINEDDTTSQNQLVEELNEDSHSNSRSNACEKQDSSKGGSNIMVDRNTNDLAGNLHKVRSDRKDVISDLSLNCSSDFIVKEENTEECCMGIKISEVYSLTEKFIDFQESKTQSGALRNDKFGDRKHPNCKDGSLLERRKRNVKLDLFGTKLSEMSLEKSVTRLSDRGDSPDAKESFNSRNENEISLENISEVKKENGNGAMNFQAPLAQQRSSRGQRLSNDQEQSPKQRSLQEQGSSLGYSSSQGQESSNGQMSSFDGRSSQEQRSTSHHSSSRDQESSKDQGSSRDQRSSLGHPTSKDQESSKDQGSSRDQRSSLGHPMSKDQESSKDQGSSRGQRSSLGHQTSEGQESSKDQGSSRDQRSSLGHPMSKDQESSKHQSSLKHQKSIEQNSATEQQRLPDQKRSSCQQMSSDEKKSPDQAKTHSKSVEQHRPTTFYKRRQSKEQKPEPVTFKTAIDRLAFDLPGHNWLVERLVNENKLEMKKLDEDAQPTTTTKSEAGHKAKKHRRKIKPGADYKLNIEKSKDANSEGNTCQNDQIDADSTESEDKKELDERKKELVKHTSEDDCFVNEVKQDNDDDINTLKCSTELISSSKDFATNGISRYKDCSGSSATNEEAELIGDSDLKTVSFRDANTGGNKRSSSSKTCIDRHTCSTVDVPRSSIDMPHNSRDMARNNIDVPLKSMDVPRDSLDVPLKSMDVPRNSEDVPSKSTDVPRNSIDVPRNNIDVACNSTDVPRNSKDVPLKRMDVPRICKDVSSKSTDVPRNSIDGPRNSIDSIQSNIDDAFESKKEILSNIDWDSLESTEHESYSKKNLRNLTSKGESSVSQSSLLQGNASKYCDLTSDAESNCLVSEKDISPVDKDSSFSIKRSSRVECSSGKEFNSSEQDNKLSSETKMLDNANSVIKVDDPPKEAVTGAKNYVKAPSIDQFDNYLYTQVRKRHRASSCKLNDTEASQKLRRFSFPEDTSERKFTSQTLFHTPNPVRLDFSSARKNLMSINMKSDIGNPNIVDTDVKSALLKLDMGFNEKPVCSQDGDWSSRADFGRVEQSSSRVDQGRVKQLSNRVNQGRVEQSSNRVDQGRVEQSSNRVNQGRVEQSSNRVNQGRVEQSSNRVNQGRVEQSSNRVNQGRVEQSSNRVDQGRVEQSVDKSGKPTKRDLPLASVVPLSNAQPKVSELQLQKTRKRPLDDHPMTFDRPNVTIDETRTGESFLTLQTDKKKQICHVKALTQERKSPVFTGQAVPGPAITPQYRDEQPVRFHSVHYHHHDHHIHTPFIHQGASNPNLSIPLPVQVDTGLQTNKRHYEYANNERRNTFESKIQDLRIKKTISQMNHRSEAHAHYSRSFCLDSQLHGVRPKHHSQTQGAISRCDSLIRHTNRLHDSQIHDGNLRLENHAQNLDFSTSAIKSHHDFLPGKARIDRPGMVFNHFLHNSTIIKRDSAANGIPIQPSPSLHDIRLHEKILREKNLHEKNSHEKNLQENLHEKILQVQNLHGKNPHAHIYHGHNVHEKNLHEKGLQESFLLKNDLHENLLHDQNLHGQKLQEKLLHHQNLRRNNLRGSVTPEKSLHEMRQQKKNLHENLAVGNRQEIRIPHPLEKRNDHIPQKQVPSFTDNAQVNNDPRLLNQHDALESTRKDRADGVLENPLTDSKLSAIEKKKDILCKLLDDQAISDGTKQELLNFINKSVGRIDSPRGINPQCSTDSIHQPKAKVPRHDNSDITAYGRPALVKSLDESNKYPLTKSAEIFRRENQIRRSSADSNRLQNVFKNAPFTKEKSLESMQQVAHVSGKVPSLQNSPHAVLDTTRTCVQPKITTQHSLVEHHNEKFAARSNVLLNMAVVDKNTARTTVFNQDNQKASNLNQLNGIRMVSSSTVVTLHQQNSAFIDQQCGTSSDTSNRELKRNSLPIKTMSPKINYDSIQSPGGGFMLRQSAEPVNSMQQFRLLRQQQTAEFQQHQLIQQQKKDQKLQKKLQQQQKQQQRKHLQQQQQQQQQQIQQKYHQMKEFRRFEDAMRKNCNNRTAIKQGNQSCFAMKQQIQHRDMRNMAVQLESHDCKKVNETCQACGNEAQFLCSRCKEGWYCSENCQIKSWKDHSKSCKRFTPV